MSEFVKGLNKNEGNDIQYKGNAFLRLMGYVKPYWKTVVICCLLVAALTALELYRPELIGNAIDEYITQETAQVQRTPDERFTGILITAGLYVGVMILSFALINLQNTTFVIHKKSYYLWIILLFISNGTYCIFLDVQQELMQQTQRNEMIIITFLGSAVISLIYLMCTQRKAAFHAFRMGKKPLIFAVLSSVSAALAIYMLMLLLAGMNAPILLTIQNGCILSLIILLGHIVLHEQITRRMVLGIGVCVISVVLLAM